MLQEFIPGGPDQDWFFHGYCDADSACRPAFTGVKERSYPAHAGLTSLGRSVPNAACATRSPRCSATARLPRDRSTSTCAWTAGTASTSCWTSTRGSARSSGCSATRRASTWPRPPTWT